MWGMNLETDENHAEFTHGKIAENSVDDYLSTSQVDLIKLKHFGYGRREGASKGMLHSREVVGKPEPEDGKSV